MNLDAQKRLLISEDVHLAMSAGIKTLFDNGDDNEKIDRKYVHKTRDGNVLISNPVIVDPEKKIYRTKLVYDPNHEFFFDHQLSHLPGMLLLEAGRQFGTAISHQFFNVPFESQFILHELNSQFVAGADRSDDVFIDVMITNAKIRKGELRSMTGIGYVHQKGEIIGKITSSWSIIPDKELGHLAKFH